MLKHIRSLSKDSLIYGLGNASSNIVSFLLLPLYTRFLTPADYGYLSVLQVYQSIAEITIAFSLSSALFRYYLMSENQREVLSTVMLAQLGLAAALAGPLFLSCRSLSYLFFKDGGHSSEMALVTGTALLGALSSLLFALMRAKRKTMLFAAVQILRTLAMTCLNIILIVRLKMDFKGVVITNLAVAALTLPVLLPFFWREFLAPFSWPLFRRMMVFSGPVYLVNLFALFLSMSDRFFLNRFLTPTDVGVYSFGSKIGTMVNIALITPFSTAVVPYAFSIAKREDFKQVFAKIIKYFALAALAFSIPIFLLSQEFVQVLGGARFHMAWIVIGPTLLSSILYGLYYAVSIQLDIAEKTYFSTVVVFAGGSFSILCNWLLIPRLGIMGAAASGLMANSLLLASMYVFCQRVYPVRHELRAFAAMAALVAGYGLAFALLQGWSGPFAAKLLAKGLLIVCLPMAVYFGGVLDTGEKVHVDKLLSRVWHNREG
jgi:O-antigen/teichoic acid export membrane protein